MLWFDRVFRRALSRILVAVEQTWVAVVEFIIGRRTWRWMGWRREGTTRVIISAQYYRCLILSVGENFFIFFICRLRLEVVCQLTLYLHNAETYLLKGSWCCIFDSAVFFYIWLNRIQPFILSSEIIEDNKGVL